MKEEFTSRIFRSDKRIRFCAIIDYNGKILSGGMRKGVESLEPPQENPKLTMQSILQQGMEEMWNKYHGRVDYVIVHREKVMLIIFALAGMKQLMISTEPDYPLAKIAKLGEMVDMFNLE